MTNPSDPDPDADLSAFVQTPPPLIGSAPPAERLLVHHKGIVESVMADFEAPVGTVATASAGGVFVDGLRSFVESVVRAALNSFAKNIGAGTPDHIISTLRAAALKIAKDAADEWFSAVMSAKAKDPSSPGGGA